jgi:hypothetical protein
MTPDRERLLTPDAAEFLTGKGFAADGRLIDGALRIGEGRPA